MLDNFHPINQPASVKQTVSLYENTFLKLKPVASAASRRRAKRLRY